MNSLPQPVVDAPSVHLLVEKLNKLWENHPIKTDFTSPPLLWTGSPSDACAMSQNNAQDRAGKRGRTCKKRTCKNLLRGGHCQFCGS